MANASIIKRYFKSFQVEADSPIFCWKPKGRSIEHLYLVKTSDILKCLDLDEKPDEIAEFVEIGHNIMQYNGRRHAGPVKNGEPEICHQTHHNFPYDAGYVPSLYVAKRYFGRNLEEIDFLFGGSILNMIATKEVPRKCGTTVIAQKYKNIIIVCKRRKHCNFNQLGYLFESLFKSQYQNRSTKLQEGQRIIKIGNFRILFCAQVDAVEKDQSVEIKYGNYCLEKAKLATIFQMISNGSSTLLNGKPNMGWLWGTVGSVQRFTLEQLLSKCSLEDCKKAENNILDCIKEMKQKIEDGKIYEITFKHDEIFLRLCEQDKSILPSAEALFDLLEI